MAVTKSPIFHVSTVFCQKYSRGKQATSCPDPQKWLYNDIRHLHISFSPTVSFFISLPSYRSSNRKFISWPPRFGRHVYSPSTPFNTFLSFLLLFFFRLPRKGYPSPRRSNTYNRSHLERLYSYTTLLTSTFRFLHIFFLFSMSTSCFYLFLLKSVAAKCSIVQAILLFLSFFLSFFPSFFLYSFLF